MERQPASGLGDFRYSHALLISTILTYSVAMS
jgi:hypothetical protein